MIAGQTHLVLIIDRSGSMDTVKTDAIGGFNSFLETQKAVPGDVVVTLVLFDHEILKIYEKLPLDQTYPLTDKTFVPRGQTSLLDAIGTTLKEVTADLDTNPSCPERTLAVVLTDGQENHSTTYKKEEIKKLVEDMITKGNFEIMYLSADMNAFADAQSYGIPIATITTYQSTSQGTQDAYLFMSDSAIQYRTTGTTTPRRTCGTIQPPENN